MKKSFLSFLGFLFLIVTASAQIPREGTIVKTTVPEGLVNSRVLVLVDGHETDFQSMVLNPNSIKEINILKDGHAVAQYGDRAKDGVIRIKTKPGTEFHTITDFINPEKDTNKSVSLVQLNGVQVVDVKKILIEKTLFSNTTTSSSFITDEKNCTVSSVSTLLITTKSTNEQ